LRPSLRPIRKNFGGGNVIEPSDSATQMLRGEVGVAHGQRISGHPSRQILSRGVVSETEATGYAQASDFKLMRLREKSWESPYRCGVGLTC